ncbi:MAG: polysaccharide deacetylase family protein [Gemmatimonadota bacterium]
MTPERPIRRLDRRWPSASTSVLVLCYHRVGEPPSSPLARYMVSPGRLDSQLRQLRERGFRFLDLNGLRRVILGEDLGGSAACVTFDDGYLDNLELGVPVLEAHSCPATFFVVTERVGRTADWDPLLGDAALMTWEHLRDLRQAGFGVGSHTSTHPWLTRLEPEAMQLELRGSRETVEDRLGEPCCGLAYPYGHRDERVVAAAGAAGYELAFTVKSGFARLHTHPLQVPRCEVSSSDDAWSFPLKVRYGWRSAELARRLLRRESARGGKPPARGPGQEGTDA